MNREHIESVIMDNDEVLFQWCMLTANATDADATVVLEMLVKLDYAHKRMMCTGTSDLVPVLLGPLASSKNLLGICART